MSVTITNHAFERCKERAGWNKKVAKKMANRAFIKGISHKDTRGRLNKYITSLWRYNKNAGNVKVYGEFVFIFAGETLITVHALPNNLKGVVKKMKKEEVL